MRVAAPSLWDCFMKIDPSFIPIVVAEVEQVWFWEDPEKCFSSTSKNDSDTVSIFLRSRNTSSKEIALSMCSFVQSFTTSEL